METLKGYMLYSLLLPESEWPLKDFGHFIDHFGTYSGRFGDLYPYGPSAQGIGINFVTFKTIAKSLFDIRDFEPNIRAWWLPNWEKSGRTEANIAEEEQKRTHVYPLPG